MKRSKCDEWEVIWWWSGKKGVNSSVSCICINAFYISATVEPWSAPPCNHGAGAKQRMIFYTVIQIF